MSKVHFPIIRRAIATGLVVLGFCGVAQAEPIYGLTIANPQGQQQLIVFDSATPGALTGVGGVTGLVAGDSLVGIDFRPANGSLYAVGVNAAGAGRIYTLNTTTGAATLVSSLTADPADNVIPFPFMTVVGTFFGVDFNPVVDRLRVVSDADQNLRINVDNGLVQLDGQLAYAGGTPNPNVTAAAYSNNFAGATTTILRDVDTGPSPDALVIQAPANDGTLAFALNLPFDSTGLTGYDVSGLTGIPYFSATSAGAGFSQLYAAGAGGVTLIGTIGGGLPVLSIAAKIPEPGSLALFGLSLAGLALIRRRVSR